MPGLGLSIPDLAARPRLYNPVGALGAALVAYWDAERTDLISQSGGLVSSWKDIVGGFDAAQATSSAKPAYSAAGLNGRPCLVADGIDDCLTLASPAFPAGASPSELWLLCTQTAPATDTATRVAAGYGGDSTSVARQIRRQSFGSGLVQAMAVMGNGTAFPTAADNVGDCMGTLVLRAEFLAGEVAITRNGAARFTAAGVPSTTALRFRMFAWSSASAALFWQGSIAAALVTQPLTAAQAAGLTAYLKTRGGIA